MGLSGTVPKEDIKEEEENESRKRFYWCRLWSIYRK